MLFSSYGSVSGESEKEQPGALDGYGHVNRYFDKKNNVWAAKILPGELYVSTQGEMITTTLGSCISACVRDVRTGIGGMNHFMLPKGNHYSTDVWGDNPITSASRYGNWAMEFLLNEILKLGGSREYLEVKVFGGGQMMASMTDIGQKNILFVYQYMADEKLKISASDVGDIYARRVIYFPKTGRVMLKRLKASENKKLVKRDDDYRKKVESVSNSNSGIELF